MAYTDPWDANDPDGTTEDAGTVAGGIGISGWIRQYALGIQERILGIFGGTFATDPWVPTKVTDAIALSGKLARLPEYDAGSSGATKILDLTTNGPNQKLLLTANCTLTIASPAAGTTGVLRLIENGSGGFTPTFPTNVNFALDVVPTPSTIANKCNLYSYYSDGTIIYMGLFGAGFAIS